MGMPFANPQIKQSITVWKQPASDFVDAYLSVNSQTSQETILCT